MLRVRGVSDEVGQPFDQPARGVVVPRCTHIRVRQLVDHAAGVVRMLQEPPLAEDDPQAARLARRALTRQHVDGHPGERRVRPRRAPRRRRRARRSATPPSPGSWPDPSCPRAGGYRGVDVRSRSVTIYRVSHVRTERRKGVRDGTPQGRTAAREHGAAVDVGRHGPWAVGRPRTARPARRHPHGGAGRARGGPAARLRRDPRARGAQRRALAPEPRVGLPDAPAARGRGAGHGRGARRQAGLFADRRRAGRP